MGKVIDLFGNMNVILRLDIVIIDVVYIVISHESDADRFGVFGFIGFDIIVCVDFFDIKIFIYEYWGLEGEFFGVLFFFFVIDFKFWIENSSWRNVLFIMVEKIIDDWGVFFCLLFIYVFMKGFDYVVV